MILEVYIRKEVCGGWIDIVPLVSFLSKYLTSKLSCLKRKSDKTYHKLIKLLRLFFSEEAIPILQRQILHFLLYPFAKEITCSSALSVRIKNRHTQFPHRLYSKFNSGGGQLEKQSLPGLRQPSENRTVTQKETQGSSWQWSRCPERPLQYGATCMAYQVPNIQLLVVSMGEVDSWTQRTWNVS